MWRVAGISGFHIQGRYLLWQSIIDRTGSNADKEAEGLWDPPRPNPWAEYPYQDQQKIFLDDIAHELAALMEQRPPSERRGNQIDPIGPPASDDLLDALEALACEYISHLPVAHS